MESIFSPSVHMSVPASIFNPLLIAMLGFVVTATAGIVYQFILMKCCMARHVTTTTATLVQPTAVHDPPGVGVDEKVLAAIPIFVFSDLDHHRQEGDECVVCLGELEGDDLVRLLPNCKHAFHVACIDTWLGAHTKCPLCRSSVTGETDPDPSPGPRDGDHTYRQNSDEEGRSTVESGGDSSLPRARSLGMLRHCASMAFPPPERRSPRLKRSRSMDQSFVVINMRRANDCSSNSPSSSRCDDRMRGSCSTSHFDRVSSKLFRSFSRLRVGIRGSSSSILPY